MSGAKILLPSVFVACYGIKFTISKEPTTVKKFTYILLFPLQFLTELIKVNA
jgi:hypothetical protein